MLPVLINAEEHVVKLSLVSKAEKGVANVKREKTLKPVNMGPLPFPANQALEQSVTLVFSAVT